MNYRFGGQQRTVSFGRRPEIRLGDARARLPEARRQLAKGLDPREQAKLEKIDKSIAAANRIRNTCSQVFRYAIATVRAERDISSDLLGRRCSGL